MVEEAVRVQEHGSKVGMVQHLNNKTNKQLTKYELGVLMDMVKVLEKTFGRKAFSVTLNPNIKDKDEIHNISVSFDYRTGEHDGKESTD